MRELWRRFAVLGSLYLSLGLTLDIGGYGIAWWRKRYENACVPEMELRPGRHAVS